jgi:hypothetical protein
MNARAGAVRGESRSARIASWFRYRSHATACRAAAALLRGHLAPLPAQLLPLLHRHLTKSAELLAHVLLFLGRQPLELLPALAHQLPLLGRHRAPLCETLLCAHALLRRHVEPTLAALGQRLLALRGQIIPISLKAV